MDDKMLPKVLAISLNAWRTDSGIHTQTDLFKFWDPERVAQIYTRSDMPDTPVCNRFFQISENAVIYSVLNRKPVGKEVQNGTVANQKALEEEKKLYVHAQKRKNWLLTLVREAVWSCGKWKTQALDQFVQNFDPDVYFIPIYPVIYTAKIQRYIMKKFPKPCVCYLWDDNYSYLNCGWNVFAYIHRFLLRRQVRKIAKNCDAMFAMTKMEAEDTDRHFGTNSIVLTKGVDYSQLQFAEKAVSKPIKMVYTGKLHIGRASSLVAISKALKEINKAGTVATLDIYSPTALDDKTMQWLNENGCCYRGVVPKQQVAEIQADADIVVFAESLERKHRYAARLSFSTKLTDYFSSGKCIFAIGDENIAPIAYLQENDAAVIATDYNQVQSQLEKLFADPEKINEYGRKAFDCGKRNHEQTAIKKTFIDTICQAANKGK